MLLGHERTEIAGAAGARTAAVMIGVTGRRWSTEFKEVAIQGMAERRCAECCDSVLQARLWHNE